MRDESPEAMLILKVCIGGAFFNKFVKGVYKNDDMLYKIQQS